MRESRRILFFKPDMAWPRSSGHDVHTYNMMKAMAGLGARVALATVRRPPAEAVEGANLEALVVLDEVDRQTAGLDSLSGLQERYRSYWGISRERITALGVLSQQVRAEAVVVSGLDVLPMLGAVSGTVRVWYAADEWFWHHLSQVKLRDPRSWANVSAACSKGLYERAFRRRIDRAWVVSRPDARAMRCVAGVRHVDVIPNGVDTDLYMPSENGEEPETAVFWGRLDFGPNVQALEWFCHDVWPGVRRERPGARFTIVGFRPTPPVETLAKLPGVELRPDLHDIRPEIRRHAVVVLPFVSGGGIKNKLLEAAAMGKAIVCTSRSLVGLAGAPPIHVADTPDDWRRILSVLWDDRGRRRAEGARARAWVVKEHTWEAAARLALTSLEDSLLRSGGR